MYRTLSKAFEIFSAMVLEVCLPSRVLLNPWVMLVRTSAIDRVCRNPYCSSLKRFIFSRFSMTFLFIAAPQSLLVILRGLMALYWDRENYTPAFLKIGHTLETLHMLTKDLSFNQRLNNFDKTGDSSGLLLLRITTGILFGPVAFIRSRSLITLMIHGAWQFNATGSWF